MNQFINLAAAAGMALLSSCSHKEQPTTVTWQMLQNNGENYTQRLIIEGDMSFDKLGFNRFASTMTPANPLDTVTEIVPGYYVLSSARFAEGKDTLIIDIITPGQFSNRAHAMDGFHRIEKDGTTSPIQFKRMPITEKEQWAYGERDAMPYGDVIYDRNEEIYNETMPGIYDVVPSYKNVNLTDGSSKTPLAFSWNQIQNDNPEYYTITVRNDSLIIGATDERRAKVAKYVFESNVANQAAELPNVEITDYPDLPYRALMLDISRNYQSPESMKHFVDLMAQYRFNTLHFHLLDDEAWRLEIKELPELTEVGSRRGYTTDESEFLVQIFSGDGNPNTLGTTNNGYFTRQDYIDFIKYAYDRGIDVIPEIESPGHARAAVKAMEKRYRATGDASYRLIEDGDTSKYTSAQAFHDNVMNPALEGPYKFMDTVISEIQSIYADAGIPLKSIHIGGDEVAHGAWDGSPSAQKFMADNNIKSQTELHGYFVNRVMQIMREKGIKVSGWQEIAIGHDDNYNKTVAPEVYSVNCWSTAGNSTVPVKSVQNGFNTILSNVERFYMDMMYNPHPEEPGLNWGGYVDEFVSFNGYPAVLCPVKPEQQDKIFGMSGHLFAETIRNPEMVEYLLLPKMLGLTERAWNNDTTYTEQQFNAIIGAKEMPRWAAEGLNFHLRQPGIKVENGKASMNSPYPGAEIRYTTDGTEPTAQSTLYNAPIDAKDGADIRARLYYNGKESLTTYSRR